MFMMRFGHAVALENGVPEELCGILRGPARAAAPSRETNKPHSLPDFARRLRRRIEQAHVHRRHSEKQRRPEIQKLRDRGFVLETFQQAHAASREQPAMQPVAERMHVKQRQRQQEPVRGT